MDNPSDTGNQCQAHRSDAVKSIKAIAEAMFQGRGITEIRFAIADLMILHLIRGKDANNHDALPHFASALSALSMNIDAMQYQSPVGLYTCLLDLEKAVSILDGDDSDLILPVIKKSEQLSYTFLIEALNAIRQSSTFGDQDKIN